MALIAADLLVKGIPRRRQDLALIGRLDGIGDFTIWLQSGAADLTHHLRKRFTKVVLLSNEAWTPMAVAIGLWDDVVAVDLPRLQSSIRYRFKTLLTIRRLGAGCLVNARTYRTFLLDDGIALSCGAGERIGRTSPPVNGLPLLLRLGNSFYSWLVPMGAQTGVHEFDRNREFCRALGATACSPPELDFLRSSSADQVRGSYFVVALGAGWSGRRWPIDKFVIAATDIKRRFGLSCVLVGGAEDVCLAAEFRGLMSSAIEDLTGSLSLLDTSRLISGAEIVLSNETGAMHISAWVGTPVVSIVGGGHFSLFAPYPTSFPTSAPVLSAYEKMSCYGCNWHCIYDIGNGPAPCVRDVSVGKVLHFIETVLEPKDAI